MDTHKPILLLSAAEWKDGSIAQATSCVKIFGELDDALRLDSRLAHHDDAETLSRLSRSANLSTLEQIGDVGEVLHGVDGAGRNVAQEPGERLDGRLRERVAGDEVDVDILAGGGPGEKAD